MSHFSYNFFSHTCRRCTPTLGLKANRFHICRNMFFVVPTCTTLDYYETSPSAVAGPVRAIQSVAVRVSTTGEGTGSKKSAFRTAPFDLKPLARSCSPQWYEGHRRLRVTKDSTTLRAEIVAKVERRSKRKGAAKNDDVSNRPPQPQQKQAPQAEGLLPRRGRGGMAEVGDDELILAFASIDANAVRDGYNYIQLFSPEPPEDGEGGSKVSGGEETKGLFWLSFCSTAFSPSLLESYQVVWARRTESGGERRQLHQKLVPRDQGMLRRFVGTEKLPRSCFYLFHLPSGLFVPRSRSRYVSSTSSLQPFRLEKLGRVWTDVGFENCGARVYMTRAIRCACIRCLKPRRRRGCGCSWRGRQLRPSDGTIGPPHGTTRASLQLDRAWRRRRGEGRGLERRGAHHACRSWGIRLGKGRLVRCWWPTFLS